MKAKTVLSPIKLEQFAYICWMLWKARNDNLHDNLHGQCVHNPTHLLERSFELYEEFHKSQCQLRACRVNQNEIWSCPVKDFISSMLMELPTTQHACIVWVQLFVMILEFLWVP